MAASSIKVLIVEDDKTAGAALVELVKRAGFKPHLVTKPADALNLVRLQTVHAAIVDVLLPKMTGVELVTEFRQTKFGDNPVIFISGVFKDRAFISDTLKKTGAQHFITKPYEADELIQPLMRSLQSEISAEKWSTQSILTSNLGSSRDRIKAIERLEEINGFDFPFILSVLLDGENSGNLNIVNQSGEIFGVSLVKGTISEIDSPDSQSAGVLALIAQGYLSQDDWDEFHANGSRKYSLEKLIEEGYVSPHAVSAARYQQVIADFRSICTSGKLRMNFVSPGNYDKPTKHAVKFTELIMHLSFPDDYLFSEMYLTEFYASVLQSPVRTSLSPELWETVWSENPFSDMVELKKQIENGGTLGAAIAANPDRTMRIYQCMHDLVLHGAVVFEDVHRARNLNSILERYRKLHSELANKSADKIFEYFGASASSSTNVIQNIFDEYSKSNHPDSLGRDITPEIREICDKCFKLVKDAYNVMMDEEQRAGLADKIKNLAAEKQARSQKLVNEAIEVLQRGQPKEALVKLLQAEELHSNNLVIMIRVWAEIKSGLGANKARVQELAKQLDNIGGEERRSAYYYMASGLVKKELGDITAALALFERIQKTDSQYNDARREIRTIQNFVASNTNTGIKKMDSLFTGDITQVVTQIFRRKAD